MASRRASFPPSVLCSLNYVFTAWPPVRQAVEAFLKQSHIGWRRAVRRLGSRIVGRWDGSHMTGRNQAA